MKSGDILVGHVPAKLFSLTWLAQKAIQYWQEYQGYKQSWPTHVKIVLYKHKEGWVVFEFTTPRAKWSVISEVPDGYRVYRHERLANIDPEKLHEAAKYYNGSPYDYAELFSFWFGRRLDPKRLFVCSTGINEMLKRCGIDLWPGRKYICPATYAEQFEEVKGE